MKIPFSLSIILLFPLLIHAYTWQFTSPPSQCSTVTLSIQGSGGQPPYSLLIVPTGPPPLPNNVEVRSIQTIPFSGTSTTLSFNLNYPENSSFVAVVSDQSGFGTGGASIPISVLQSSDSSCYSASNPVHYNWFFYVSPDGLEQCGSVRLWWNAAEVDGTVSFDGVIPGGNSFAVPPGSLSTNSDTGTGFDWLVDITAATDVLLIANDNGGIGAGGIVEFTVGSTNNNSCLNNNSPSSTAGNPAGGSYPTGTSTTSVSSSKASGSYPTSTSTSTPINGSGGSGSGGNHSSSNTGAIVGGLVGAAIVLGLIAFWFVRRRSGSAYRQERPVNILQDDENGGDEEYRQGLPQFYVPEPYSGTVPDSTTRATSEAASTYDRPLSIPTSIVAADMLHPQTPTTPTTTTTTTTATTRKSASSRPVNIIEHDDAGPSEDLSDQVEPETIELPPAYSNIRQLRRTLLASSTRTAVKDEP